MVKCMDANNPDYGRIEKAIRFIEASALEQPSLEEIAAHIGLSPYHFQRLFTRWAGVSPKRFLQFLTVEHAKQCLSESESVLDTSCEVGLSGPSRLHDLFVSVEAVTPGEFKSGGAGLELRYGIHDTPFGNCLVAASPRGICALEFLGEAPAEASIQTLRERWRGASLIPDHRAGTETIAALFAPAGEPTADSPPTIRLYLKGSNFQLKVWQALLSIPEGRLVSYGWLARKLGMDGSARALGSAIGRNPVGFIIPCHRVLRASGEIGGYHWGIARKKAIIAYEASSPHRQ